MLGHEDVRHVHPKYLGGFGSRAVVDRSELEGLPGGWAGYLELAEASRARSLRLDTE